MLLSCVCSALLNKELQLWDLFLCAGTAPGLHGEQLSVWKLDRTAGGKGAAYLLRAITHHSTNVPVTQE